MPETLSAELYCPECGYDLRGIESGRCPECGGEIDRSQLGESLIPWRHRRRLGLVRALVQTFWLASFKPAVFAREMNRPADFADAVRFRRVVCFIALIPIGILATIALSGLLYERHSDSYRVWVSDDKLGSVAQLVGIVFMWLCLWLYLLASSGAPSYFFHPRSLDVVRQNRAIALSYYTCAPLILTPLIVALGITILLIKPPADPVPAYTLAFALLIVIGLLLVQLYLLAILPARLLASITHRGRAWALVISMLIGLLRVVLALPILIILPVMYAAMTIALLSLFE
jgi:hypothetical protein